MSDGIPGIDGYAGEAEELLRRYEAMPFADLHRHNLHLIPKAPARVLDIGAGTGRDAAAFAALGHQVVAVEPTGALREGARLLHPSPSIDWVDDGLPDLNQLRTRNQVFDLVMMTGVWMHLDADERRRAMPNVASLMRPGGVLIMSLRHGPVPAGRRMFEVTGQETIGLAEQAGLRLVQNLRAPSIGEHNRRAGVTWTHLAFVKDQIRG
jgi:SAM-dependent methyltransferase